MSQTDKSKLPSRHVSVGPASAPHRSYYYAMGMTEQEIAQPFVGVVTTWNEAAPCNIALGRQAQAVKKGDKSLPGLMMAMVRLNIPSVFMYGGSILPGRFRGKDVTVQDVFEAVGRHSAGTMSSADLHELETVACPSAPYDSRDAYAEASGEAIMTLIAKNIRPRDICTRKAFENAATVVAASGGSTNAALHLPAMAHECGIDFD